MQEDLFITVTIIIRLLAAFGAYWTVIRRMMQERKDIPLALRGYNMKLIISVFTFIVTCIGTSFFQTCRAGWLPGCSTQLILDEIALFNSFGLLAAYYVMHQLVNATDKQKEVVEDKSMGEIKKAVKETKKSLKIIGEQTKKAEVRSEEIDANTAGKVGNIMRGRGRKGKGKA